MNIIFGSQLAVAIEDLADLELLQSEVSLGERISREVAANLPLRAEYVPRKLINGFMRGSTTIKDEQLADEIAILQRKLNDRQDPMLIVAILKNALESERKDIHIKRTQKSAVRQILRALKEDIDSVNTTRPGMSTSFVKTQEGLLLEDIGDLGHFYDWATRVQSLFEDLFVDFDNTIGSSSFKPKGIVSRLAANNYGNSWIRFIKERTNQIFELAATSKPLMTQSFFDSSYSSNTVEKSALSLPAPELVRVRIENSGQGAIKFEKTWASRAQARQELKAFLSLLNTLIDASERIDLVEISIESNNGISLSLQEITQSKTEETLNKLLSD